MPLFLFLFLLLTFTAPAASTLYVQASRLNLRAEPNEKAKLVGRLPIGTEVNTEEKKGDWCKVGAAKDKQAGFVLCSLLAAEKPTLEAIDAKLAKAKPNTSEFEDLFARKFLLSPSIFTLLDYRKAIGLSQPDDTEVGPDGKPYRSSLPKDRLSGDLIKSFSGTVSGNDFRPVISKDVFWPWADPNPNPSYPGQKFYPPAPKIRTSLFRRVEDAMAWIGEPFLKQSHAEIFKSPSGKAEARYLTTAGTHSHLWPLAELAKASISSFEAVLGPPIANHDLGDTSIGGAGEIQFHFPDRVPIFFVTRRGAMPGELLDLKGALGEPGCVDADEHSGATFALSAPASDAIQILLLLPWKKTLSNQVKPTKSGAWSLLDIDGDGIADFAWTDRTEPGVASAVTVRSALLLMNIDGKWYIADQVFDEDCT